MSDELTSEQVAAITYAWLDITASHRIFSGDTRPMDYETDELRYATEKTKADLEKAFPFLLQPKP